MEVGGSQNADSARRLHGGRRQRGWLSLGKAHLAVLASTNSGPQRSRGCLGQLVDRRGARRVLSMGLGRLTGAGLAVLHTIQGFVFTSSYGMDGRQGNAKCLNLLKSSFEGLSQKINK